MQRPVGQAHHPAAAGHQLHHHRGQLGVTDAHRLDPGRLEKVLEDVQALPIHRIADQGFAGQIGRLHPLPAGQRMIPRDRELGFVAEQRQVSEAGIIDRVGGDHQIEVPPGQGRQRRKVETAGNVELHVVPDFPIPVDGRQQPFEAAVALDGHEDAARLTAGQAHQVLLRAMDQRQHLVGQPQQPLAGAGEPHWPGLADEQRTAESGFQVFQLV